MNRNFVFETDVASYFIKSLRDKCKNDAIFIGSVETLMHSRGIPAICALSSSTGRRYFEHESKVYMVYPFVESNRSHRYNENDMRSFGSMLGKIHRAGSRDITAELQTRILKKDWARRIEDLKKYKELLDSRIFWNRDGSTTLSVYRSKTRKRCNTRCGVRNRIRHTYPW